MENKIMRLLLMVLVMMTIASGCAPQLAPAQLTPSANSTPTPAVSEGINIGNRAIDFELQTLDGKTIKLNDFRGKPVLLNFWATWCEPCRSEMPYLQQTNETWSAKGLVILAVDIGESPATVQKFMTELNLSLMVAMDTDSKVAKAYGITVIPTTFLIDKNGVIQQKVPGAFPNKAAIETELKTIIP